MEIKKYSKKKLYSILRNSLIGLANYSVLNYLLDIYTNKDEIEFDKILLKIFAISKNEYDDFYSFENYPRDYISPKPSFYSLNRNDLCNIIKTVIQKLHDAEYMHSLKNYLDDFKIKHPSSTYVSHSFLLNLFELRSTEYNEIINFEETLFFQGVKDNGRDELTPETEEMIKKFLIKGLSASGERR